MQRPALIRSILHIIAVLSLLALPAWPAAASPAASPALPRPAAGRPGLSRAGQTAPAAPLAAPTGAVSGTADLALSMIDSPDPMLAGSPLTYTLNVTNNGPSTVNSGSHYASAAGLTIPVSGKASPYPSTITVAGWSGTVSKVRVTLSGITHTLPDDLDVLLVGPQGQKVMLMSDVGGVYDLTGVTLLFGDSGAALPDNTTISPGLYRPTDLGLTETMPSPAPGRPYSTVLSAFNGVDPNGAWSLYVNDDSSTGSGSIGGWSLSLVSEDSGVALTTTLPSGATFVSASGTNWDCYNADSTVTCLPISLPAGALPPVTVNILPSQSSGTTSGTATIASGFTDPDPSNNSATAVTTITPLADLALTTSASEALAGSGGTFTYTLTVSNGGPSAASAITLTNVLPAELTLLSVSGSGWSCAGSAAVTCTLPSLAEGAASAITLVTQVANTTAAISNSASVASATTDPVSGNNSVSFSVQPYPAVDLRITKQASASTLSVGKTLTYTLSVTNTSTTSIGGGSAYQNTAGLTIPTANQASPYPSTITVAGWSGTVSKVRVTLSKISHTFPDDLDVLLVGPQGQKVMLMSDVGGGFGLAGATLVFGDSGAALPDNGAISSALYRPTDLEALDTMPSPAPAQPYSTALSAFNGVDPNGTWSLYVNDDTSVDGGSIAGWSLTLLSSENGVAVSDPLPSGATFVSASGTNWDCYDASGIATCLPISLPVGALPPITVVTLAPNTAGTITNTATVSSMVTDSNPGDNQSSATTTLIDTDSLAISVAADPSPAHTNGRLVYALTVANLNTKAANSVVVNATLPAGVTLLGVMASGWTCSGTTTMSCTRATLDSGASNTINLAVRAPSSPAALSASASVSSYWPDIDPSNNSASLATEVVQRDAALEIASPAYGAVVRPGTAITVSGTAADPDGIQSVKVMVGGALLETLAFDGAPSSANWTTSLTWAPPALGTYSIAAVLLDSTGASITDTISIIVEPTAAPGGVSDMLAMWLKADQGVALGGSGSAVTGWLDQSGNQQHLAQSTGSNQPAYQAAAINGNPAVNFDTTDYLTRTVKGSALFSASAASVLFAKQSIGGGVWFKWETSNSNRVGFELSASAARFDMASDSAGRLDGLTQVAGGFRLVSGVKSTSTQSLYVDGATDVSRSNSTVLSTSGTAQLTLGKNPDGTLNWNGMMAEVIVFGRALSSAEQARVESYMAIKYGTTMLASSAAGKNYVDSSGATIWDATAKSAYHHDVAGIGRDDASGLLQLSSRSINSDAVVTMAGAGASDRAFLLWGNNDAALTSVITGSLPGGQYRRLARIWQVQKTGLITGTSVSFDTSGITVTVDPASVALLVGSDADFQNATTHTAGRTVDGATVSFDHVGLSDGAYFSLLLGQANLSVTVSGPGGVSSQPAGIDCGATCAAGYDFGAVVTLTATAASNATFIGWGGDCADASPTCAVTLDQARSVSAAFCRSGASVSSASDSGPGSLRQAISDVCPGGTISFAADASIALGSTLSIAKALTIDGAGHAVSISGDSDGDGDGDVRPFEVSGGAVTLSALTITSGFADTGGAIRTSGALTITGSVIKDSVSSGDGGGIANSGSLAVINSTISGNRAGTFGGGLNSNGRLIIQSSTLSGNQALSGGGIFASGAGSAQIENSTLAANTASSGGGIYAYAAALALSNSTLAGNSAVNEGASLSASLATVTVTNSILADGGISGECRISGGSITVTATLVEDGSCGATLSGDPRLAALAGYGGATQTFALLPGSPALDSGAACLASDQRGVARPQGAGCDLGAFESRGFALAALSGGGQLTALNSPFPTPLAVRLSALDSGLEVGAGYVITFTAPLSGASLGTPVLTATTSLTGTASVSVSANATEGSYAVSASTQFVAAPASFALQQFDGRLLSVSRTGTGAGAVTSNPPAIACGGTCAAAFAYGTVVTLTATAAAGSVFAGWSGACDGSASACVVTLDQARTVSARFDRTLFRVFMPQIIR